MRSRESGPSAPGKIRRVAAGAALTLMGGAALGACSSGEAPVEPVAKTVTQAKIDSELGKVNQIADQPAPMNVEAARLLQENVNKVCDLDVKEGEKAAEAAANAAKKTAGYYGNGGFDKQVDPVTIRLERYFKDKAAGFDGGCDTQTENILFRAARGQVESKGSRGTFSGKQDDTQ